MAKRSRARRLLRVVGVCALLLVLVVAGVAVYSYRVALRSLARTSGETVVAGLSAPVEVSRDGLGVVRIEAANRADLARALGFVHAQERFVQMDFSRRYAAGEAAALVGPPGLAVDTRMRPLRLRHHARLALEGLPQNHREFLAAYTQGVNAGLADLEAKPPEYFLLRANPEPWREEDSLLVALALFRGLNFSDGFERSLGVMRAALAEEMFAFLTPDTARDDAPLIEGPGYEPMPIPGPGVVNLRPAPEEDTSAPEDMFGEHWGAGFSMGPIALAPPDVLGSNNWAVSGARSATGAAILANDMHLGLTAPGVWMRVQMEWAGRRSAGVSLPGVPGIVAGSNGSVAWGYTNVYGDFMDYVLVEEDPADRSRYRTPEGWEAFEEVVERIEVRGEEPHEITLRTTRWGVVTEERWFEGPLALKWTALEPGGLNLRIMDLAEADTLEEAVEVAAGWRGPAQNVLIAADDGRIAWVVSGYLPDRRGFDGRTPASWAHEGVGWFGERDESQRPRVIDPESGVLYTANNRTLPLARSRALGYEWAGGARAQRISALLDSTESLDEPAMLRMQLDTRTAALDFFRDLLLETIPEDDYDHDLRAARALAATWSGHADADDRAHRLIRRLRERLREEVLDPLLAPCRDIDPAFQYRWPRSDEPLKRILEEQPEHLLPAAFPDWSALIRFALAETIEELDYSHEAPGVDAPWGDANRSAIRHPLTAAVASLRPYLGWLLDMPNHPQHGDALALRVSGPGYGASQRTVVSPGHEERGILHTPAGQSGHFLSPHYRAGHEDWLEGRPTPMLAGDAVSTLRLAPGR